MLADSMSKQAGWNIVVENKPGAGGNLALDSTARAKPDGHTLVMAQTDNIVLNPWLYKKLVYDTFKDFTPIGLVASSPSRSEEHTSELQSLMRISYAVFCLNKKKQTITSNNRQPHTYHRSH